VSAAWFRLALTLAARGIVHPPTGIDLVRVAWRFRRRRWWARPPWMPVPARDYVRWRMVTAYGNADAVPRADEIVRYARWACRSP
jgi:hypothetical protein